MIRLILVAIAAVCLSAPAISADTPREGQHLYQVTTLRAAPGEFERLLAWHAELATKGFYEAVGLEEPLLMRHSQGDQWDLMLIQSMQSFTAYYSEASMARYTTAAARFADLLLERGRLIAFEEDNFAYGPAFDSLRKEYDASGLFHIEMFAALPGKTEELLEQRRMENDYLAATGQVTNMIFRRGAGSDIDVFTIGFHESLESFAAPAAASDARKESAARDAGFKDRADLSFYLRSLLAGHHDTLAVRVGD